ncbi:RICIN domain-containing protein [Streptomyces sp. NPDC058301]|uniref:RICIN domain-containing protein n=1 Tax=Streptomyces sp. NPDC058301 TaxID=3346436 RepID=UPI0036EF4C54
MFVSSAAGAVAAVSADLIPGPGANSHPIATYGDPSVSPYDNLLDRARNKAGNLAGLAPKLISQGGRFDPYADPGLGHRRRRRPWIPGVTSGLCLDVTGGSTANGAWPSGTCNGGSNQKWTLR